MLCKIMIKKNTNFRANTLRNIPEKFQLNLLSSFRGEDFWKSLRRTDDRRTTDGRQTDDGRRRTQSDDKSSHCLRQGELKTTYCKFRNYCVHLLLSISRKTKKIHFLFLRSHSVFRSLICEYFQNASSYFCYFNPVAFFTIIKTSH